MKKMLFLILLISLSACGLFKHKPTTESSQLKSVSSVDTVYIERTARTVDTVKITVPVVHTLRPDCDSLCQKELELTLQQLAFTRRSGNNAAGFYYDAYKKQLVAYAALDSTLNVYKAKHHKEISTVTTTVTIKERYTPRLTKIFAWIGALALIIAILYIVFKIKVKL
ncbi:hypothetical protein SAMN05444369_11026 [Capnocytophaga haemolytica]|uniref:Uncharacterized protein n=1 Tax=Capnocytophaga haemolytica TaxID=45243 RepID=A0AAX2GWJ5_9FLAO|nr:hypothetical protein [Capnocytophaga haemolytica]AMD85434.1 hypothetical protein AXF12_07860 [Capnocytophaga haemolytica]SFO12373.1 hypothetical protein SAMN05444369_11026 [Capnocytophaga haemolytica]SNV01643.1 Uncharacterised protein [Capnocytophaga haemolytica]